MKKAQDRCKFDIKQGLLKEYGMKTFLRNNESSSSESDNLDEENLLPSNLSFS